MVLRRNRPRPRSVEHRLARRQAHRQTPHRRGVTLKKITTKRTRPGSVLRLAPAVSTVLASLVAIAHHVIQMIRGA
jgi:ribosomal protein S12